MEYLAYTNFEILYFRYGDLAALATDIPNIKHSDPHKYLIGHPEDFLAQSVFKLLRKPEWHKVIVGCFIDEAHCTELWGKRFRLKYGQIHKLRSVTDCPFVALTGSASTDMCDSISSRLKLKDPAIIRTSVDRPNIKLKLIQRKATSVKYTLDQAYEEIMFPLIQELDSLGSSFPKTIVYGKLKWLGYCDEMSLRPGLQNAHEHSTQYHAPMTDEVMK